MNGGTTHGGTSNDGAPTGPDAATQDRLLALLEQGQLEPVQAAATQLTRQWPEHGFGWKLLGVVAQRLGRVQESLAAKQRAAALLADDAEAQNNLGNAYAALGRLAEAEASLRRAVALRPAFAEALNNLGLVIQRLGRLGEAGQLFQAALAARPDFTQAHSNWLFVLSHDASVPPAQVFAAHQAFGQRHGAALRAGWRAHANPRDPERRLRVGFVSGDLCQHAVAYFIAPIWRAMDRRELEIVAYNNTPRSDAMTDVLRALADRWVDVATLDDAALADTIRADGIDILFDLSGHTRHNRLLVFARKPAPLQVTAIGYPHTTGLAAMDYRISDHFRMPPALAAQNVEHLALIPCSGTFEHGPAPDVNPLPALASGVFTFGSFQRTQKIGPASLALWGQVLRALPDARMLIGAVDNAAARRHLAERLAAHGVAPERLSFHPPMKMADYLALHHRIDMLLDTTPYPGGTTTHHGLWMGVPTLTRTGDSVVSWQGAANLLRLGLDDFVAHDDAQFVQLAQRWAADLPALARLRAALREHIANHPLVRPEFVARGMQAALRTMWRRWCAGQPAASFEVAGPAAGRWEAR